MSEEILMLFMLRIDYSSHLRQRTNSNEAAKALLIGRLRNKEQQLE